LIGWQAQDLPRDPMIQTSGSFDRLAGADPPRGSMIRKTRFVIYKAGADLRNSMGARLQIIGRVNLGKTV
jgi:hypothetical protein